MSGVPLQVLTNSLGPLATAVGTGSATISGAFQSVPQTNTVRANIKGSSFNTVRANMHPQSVPEFSTFAIDLQPGGATRGWIGATPDLINYIGSIYDASAPIVDSDLDLGDISYGNPFPTTWTPFILSRYDSYVSYYAQGASSSGKLYSYSESVSTTLPTSSSGFGLLVGPPSSPTIGGSNFFNDHSAVGTRPTVSWQVPTLGTATGYRLSIYNLYNDGTGASKFAFVATLYTKQTSLVIPPELLSPGLQYVFKLSSVNLQARDIEQSPYRYGFPYGYSQTSSGIVTP